MMSCEAGLVLVRKHGKTSRKFPAQKEEEKTSAVNARRRLFTSTFK